MIFSSNLPTWALPTLSKSIEIVVFGLRLAPAAAALRPSAVHSALLGVGLGPRCRWTVGSLGWSSAASSLRIAAAVVAPFWRR